MISEDPAQANASASTEVTSFKRFAIPLIRRIYPQLVMNNIMSVQPLTGGGVQNWTFDEEIQKICKPKRYISIDEPAVEI